MTPNIRSDLTALPGTWDARAGMAQYEPTEAHYQRAAEWLSSLREIGEMTSPAFEAWKAENPAHAFAFAEVETMFAAASRPTRMIREENRSPHNARPRRRLWRGAAAGLAACLALMIAVPRLPPLSYLGAGAVSAAGEMRTLRLADGSQVMLNTRSALDMTIDAHGRSARLRGGEAYFEIARDPSRPFTIMAGNAAVRVLGTGFNIRIDEDQTAVSVTHGRVRVTSRTHADQAVELTYGQQALVDARHMQVQASDPIAVNAWRQKKLFFVETPMRLVVRDLNRYRAEPIILLDRSLGNYKVTGVFSTEDPDAVVRSFERILGVTSFTLPTGHTLLW